jgi:hypothetical protein
MAIKVSIKKSSSASAVPTSSDLIEGQLAVNFADKRLFTEDASGNILELGINPSSITTGAITASGTVTVNGSLVTAAAAFTGGTINGTVIGGSTPAAITGTTVTGTSLVGPLTGNSTGTHTGAVTGNVTGNITGSGSSTLTTLAVTNFTAGGLTYPTSDGGANTVLATNGSGALSFISVSGAYDLASQSEAEAGTETAGRIFSPLRVKQAIDALGLTNVVSDTTPQLGGDLDGQGKDITDVGVLTADTTAPIYGSSSSPIVLTVTVASKTAAHAYNGDGSSDGYFINGIEAPAIELGGSDAATANTEYVYKFDQSDSSNSGHPLVFYLDAAKATAYTTGVTTSGTPGSSGAYTQIAVDSETPKILYYQCSSHAYMGNYAVVPASLSFSAGTLRIAGTAVTSTGAELNILDGVTTNASELNLLDALSRGSLIYGNSSAATAILTKGAADTVLTSDGTDISWVAPAPAGNIHSFTASGAVASGKPVILNANGTVTQVTAVAEALGSQAVFQSAAVEFMGSCYDPDSGKTIITFGGDGTHGWAVVATPASDNSITFGTPVKFAASSVEYTAVSYDTGQDRVLIAYSDKGDSYKLKAIVGTVSGTSISYGSAATIDTNDSRYIKLAYSPDSTNHMVIYADAGNSSRGTARCLTVTGGGTNSVATASAVVYNSTSVTSQDVVYDTSQDKFVVFYRDTGNSNYGECAVGSISGTTISFGSSVALNSADTNDIALAFDSTNEKTVVIYKTSQDPRSRVISVSGTTPSAGSEVVISSLSGSGHNGITFDSQNGKIVACFDNEDTSRGQYAIGTVSGTSITYATPVDFNTDGRAYYNSPSFNANVNKVVLAFGDVGNSSYGTGQVLQVAGSNVTATNFVGIANAAISDSASGSVTVQGGLITNSNLATLTIGSTYYVQNDGTFATTTSNVTAGKALAASTLLLKGI